MMPPVGTTRTTRRAKGSGSTGLDVSGTAGGIGLFETANGLPHGLFGILVALGAALLLVPIRALWRAARR